MFSDWVWAGLCTSVSRDSLVHLLNSLTHWCTVLFGRINPVWIGINDLPQASSPTLNEDKGEGVGLAKNAFKFDYELDTGVVLYFSSLQSNTYIVYNNIKIGKIDESH